MRTYLNPLNVVFTSRSCGVRLTKGEFVLESGVRVCGPIEGGDAKTPGVAQPCDLHEVVFSFDSLGVKRSSAANTAPIEAVASVSDKFAEIEGTLEVGPGGQAHLRFGGVKLELHEPGKLPFKLKRG